MYDARTNLSLQVVENVRKNLEQNIYNAIIPRNVRLAEAPSHGLPISMYDAKSAGAEAYRDLAEEILKQDGHGEPEVSELSGRMDMEQEDKKAEKNTKNAKSEKNEKAEKKKRFKRK